MKIANEISKLVDDFRRETGGPEWPKLILSNSSFEVQLQFINGTVLTTTDLNAARALMIHSKYNLLEHVWIPLEVHEIGLIENYMLWCTSEKALTDDILIPLLKSVIDTSIQRCIVDPTCITVADIAMYHTLNTYTKSISNKKLPNFIVEWIKYISSSLLHNGLSSSESKITPVIANNSKDNTNFIRQIVEEDLKTKKHHTIVTRFPPEPNGFLHLGHAKSICLNFGLARDYQGVCHLRFDDTNPTKEDMRFIESIMEDVKWLGGDWGHHLYFASDYFDQLHLWAVDLIKKHLAYVDDQPEDELRKNRGDLTTPGIDSPYRNRSIEENLMLFEKMKNGEFPEGQCVLRAKISMSHGNMNMRDPPIYRIKFHPHPRTGNKWVIYPIYDFAHGQSDSIEKITHSICTLEFEDHRPLYEWFQEKLGIFKTRQIEFARLNCTYVVMSKRKLITLVDEKLVHDWDDPRLPTISGMRRKGFPASAIRDFCERIGVAKRSTTIPLEYLETCVANAIHPVAHRRNVVLDPLKVIITNFPTDTVHELKCPNHPEDATQGERILHFTSELYIDRSDFMITPPPKFFRLYPGNEVRLRYGYCIRCHSYKTDSNGIVTEVHCTYDPDTKGGNSPLDHRKVKGTLHWVSLFDATDISVNMYDRLFLTSTPDDVPEGKVWQDFINPHSLTKYTAKAEKSIATAIHPSKTGGLYYQFERIGFFVADYDSTPEAPIMNLTVRLVDSWAASTDSTSKEAQNKQAAKIARENAARERQLKKEKKELRLAAKKQTETAKATITNSEDIPA